MGKGPVTHFDAHRVSIAGEEVIVLTAPVLAASPLSALTAAENDIVSRLLRGDSNASIARARRTSAGTVAKQVSAVYRKLGVRSRRELVALFA